MLLRSYRKSDSSLYEGFNSQEIGTIAIFLEACVYCKCNILSSPIQGTIKGGNQYDLIKKE